MATINSIGDLSALIRGRRQDLDLSQAELAARAKVSRQWISAFERGRPGAELQLILRLIDALDLRLAVGEEGDAQIGPEVSNAVDLDALLENQRDG